MTVSWENSIGLTFDNRSQEKRAMAAVNRKLHTLGQRYHKGLPLAEVSAMLTEEGFSGMSDGVYCGSEGRVHEQVGPHTWLALSWYRMESGRYEIVAYLS